MKRIIRTLLLAAVAFVLAAGDAHAYDSDYNVKIESRLDQQTGQWVSVVTFTSALDGKEYFISEEEYHEACTDGVSLAHDLADRKLRGEPDFPLYDCQVRTAVPAMKHYDRDAVYVKFYIDAEIAAATHETARLAANAQRVRPDRSSNDQASVAMNRLQDAKGKPHVISGVWYDAATDTYHWVGPTFNRPMSEPASEFLSEVGPYIQ